jgi:tRNA pseudouridine55 synthase
MNGVVVIDKPAGMTSHDVVNGMRRVLGIRKIGHAGTLDPLATGVLIVCINEATKLMPFFERHRKEYLATMRLGIQTDTLDREGRVISEEIPSVTSEQVSAALQQFVGKIRQIPPRYSAVKFQGRPLYAWTRKGIDIAPLPRMVEIFSITMEAMALPEATLRVRCGKGTYIRSLCADLGDKLGCGACLTELRRTSDGPFGESSALSLTGHAPERQKRMLAEGLIRLTDALPALPSIEADPLLLHQLRNGRQPTAAVMRDHDIPFLASGDMVKFIDSGRNLAAVARALHASEEMNSAAENVQVFEVLRVFKEC